METPSTHNGHTHQLIQWLFAFAPPYSFSLLDADQPSYIPVFLFYSMPLHSSYTFSYFLYVSITVVFNTFIHKPF